MVAREPREDVDTLERPQDRTDRLSGTELDRFQAEIEQIVRTHGQTHEWPTEHDPPPCATDQEKIARIARRLRSRVERMNRP